MGASFKVTQRLYLNADKTKVVKEGSPDAAFLFATPGKEIPAAEAEKYGLTKSAKKADSPEDKKAAAPANKARKSTTKKG